MLSVAEATDLLTAESRLLDERRFLEWNAMFDDDGVYWVPMDARTEDYDPGGRRR